MKPTVEPEIKEIMEAVHYRPAVSIIMPFDLNKSAKTELHHSLETAADKLERELLVNYPVELKMLVMRKIRAIIKNLHFDTHKKSIAIYASPVFEKVLYLDIPVEERIIIDESFEIRDLVYGKKQIHKYLLLHISGKQSSLYLGNAETFIKIVFDAADSVQAYVNDAPERVANFSDTQQRKQIDIEKFLRHTDNSLDLILHAYHLPLFVMGAEKVLGHFKKITKHNSSIIEYIHGNYEEATLSQLNDVVGPFINEWKKVLQNALLNQLEKAASDKKLAVGIKDVWREAMARKGKLLLVEKNYMYAAERGSSDEVIYKAIEPYNTFSYIKDAVDDIIEKVLENGGDVEFVDEGLLKDWHHIALIQFY